MRLNIDPSLVKNVIAALFVLVLVKLLWFVVEIAWLPVQGIDHAEDRRVKPLYYRVKLTPNQSQAPKVAPKPTAIKSSIKDIQLLAVYHSSDTTVVTIIYKGKTKVLSRGEEIDGFVLEDAGSQYAIFNKNGKQYRVTLASSKNGGGKYNMLAPSKEETPQPPEISTEGVVDAGDHKIVDRTLLEHYTKDMKRIYKEVGISEVKKGDKIDGFRVTFVKRDTPFAKLGLQRGDILKSINGQELDSYNAAFEAYKNINKATNVTLVVQRGNKEMELEYEIN